MRLFAPIGEQISAHHRGRRQRDGQRDHDRDRQGHREFTEQPSDDAAHQQDRHEHRDQRQAHRQDRKADLAGALQRCLHSRLAGFDVPRHIFQHDDRIIDDKTGRDRQRHQRQIVETVAQQIHHPERADQRDRHRDARDQGGAQVPQEREHDQDHQNDRDDQGSLDIVQRCPDRDCPVQCQRDVDGARDRGLELRQDRFDAIDRVDDVGTRLFVKKDQNRRLAVRKPLIAQIFDPVAHFPDIGQPHRRAVAISDHQRPVIGGVVRLVVGVDLEPAVVLFDGALRTVGVGRGERGAHVFQADPVFEQRKRIELDAYRRQ